MEAPDHLAARAATARLALHYSHTAQQPPAWGKKSLDRRRYVRGTCGRKLPSDWQGSGSMDLLGAILTLQPSPSIADKLRNPR
jgi:hypothetical protein